MYIIFTVSSLLKIITHCQQKGTQSSIVLDILGMIYLLLPPWFLFVDTCAWHRHAHTWLWHTPHAGALRAALLGQGGRIWVSSSSFLKFRFWDESILLKSVIPRKVLKPIFMDSVWVSIFLESLNQLVTRWQYKHHSPMIFLLTAGSAPMQAHDTTQRGRLLERVGWSTWYGVGGEVG